MNFENDIKNLNYNGYTILKNFLNKDECTDYINFIKECATIDYGNMIKKKINKNWDGNWVHNLQNKNIKFLDFINNPYLEKILSHKLNDKFYRSQEEDDPNYILQLFSARSPGKTYLDLHTDMRAKSTYDSTLGLTILAYLTDTNKENGCTFLVPGSHNINLREAKNSYVTDRDFKNVLPIEVNAGDVLIFDQGIWHGSFKNTTNEKPWRLMAGFHRWWIKQSFDIPSSLPNNIYKKLSNKQKSILGFCSIPPKNELERLSMSCKYKDLKDNI